MREALFLLLRSTLIPALVRELVQRRRATILVWHDPDPDAFERHLRLLRRLYTPVSLRAVVDAIKTGRMRELPPKPLVLTLDDGHEGNARLLPVIERYGVPVTIFLCSAIIGTRRPFPFVLGRASSRGREDREPGRHFGLSEEAIERMRHAVDFQSHTATHSRLPLCTTERARREIAGSKRELERRFGLEVYALAYPNGDYSDRDIELAKEAGYGCALAADAGFNGAGSDLFRLRRLTLDDGAGPSELVVKASGVWAFLKRLVVGQPYGYRPATAEGVVPAAGRSPG